MDCKSKQLFPHEEGEPKFVFAKEQNTKAFSKTFSTEEGEPKFVSVKEQNTRELSRSFSTEGVFL